jgi:hypothetical protein
MNQPMFKRVFPQALAWAGFVALSGALALAQGAAAPPSPAAAVRTDGQIEMDVVHALDASTVLKNDLITAATIQSQVTLSGTVVVASSRELAESIASHVQGVVKVNNSLKVGDAQNPPSAQETADNQQGDAGAPNSAASPSAPDRPDGPLPPPDESEAQAQLRAQIRAEVIAEIQAQRRAHQQARGQDPSSPDEYQPGPPPPAQEVPKGPVTIPQGILLQLRTSQSVGSKHAKDGEPVQFTVIRDVTVGGVLAIPRGATAHGVVTEVTQAGELKGSPELALRLTSLDLGGQSYPVDSGQFKVKGPGKGERTANNMIGGTLMGTMIGCIAGRGAGCAIGAGAGLAAGTVASAATPGPNVWIPAEAQVAFRLNSPLTVTPVSATEAARLAQGLYSGGPTLHQRGGYGQPYPYPYGYPPVYYHPYYAVGGYYYWR